MIQQLRIASPRLHSKLLDMAETMTATERAANETSLVEYLDLVQQYKAPGVHQAIGFNGGRLYYFDGHDLRPISLKESVEWCAALEDAEKGEGWDDSPKVKWLRMVAQSL